MVVLAAVKIGEILRWACSFTGDRREACGGLEAGPQALPTGLCWQRDTEATAKGTASFHSTAGCKRHVHVLT